MGLQQMSTRDKRALLIGGLGALGILLYSLVVSPWLAKQSDLQNKVKDQEQLLERIGMSSSPKAQMDRMILAKKVPTYEMPDDEDMQRLLFERAFSKQLKDSGVKTKGMPQFITKGKRIPQLGMRQLKIQGEGSCKFEQALDLLAKMYENPHLVSVEEFKLTCDEKKRKERLVQVSVTVTTLTK
jgi:type II secretory pathway component PulM